MSERCERSQEIESLFDQRLDEAAAERASSHAAGCAACRRLLERLQALRTTLRDAAAPPNAFAMKRLRRSVVELGGEQPAGKRRIELRWARLMVPVLTLTLAALGAVFLWPRSNATEVTLVAAPGAQYERETNGAKDVVRLTDGEFDFDVRAHASGKRLLVVVPDGEIEDIGTRFRVVVKDGATSEIAVSEGEVEFRREGVPPLRLIAGMSYRPLAPDAPASPPRPPPAAEVQSSAAPATAVKEPTLAPTAAPQKAVAIAPAPGPSHKASTASAKSAAPAVAAPTVAAPTVATASVAAPAVAATAGATPEDLAYMRVVRLMRSGNDGDARALARQYLVDFPNGLRRTEMAALAASPR